MWHEKRNDALECIKDLSRNYFGVLAASCKYKNKTLKDWLEHLLSEVISLNHSAIGSSGRTIHRLLSTLKDIELLHQIMLLRKSTAMDYVNTEQSTHLVNRINKEELGVLMQMDQQLCDARQAAKLCTISEGLRNISKNFDDLINLNLGGWLRQMIERELAVQLEGQLKRLSSPTYGDIESNLNSLSDYMLSQMQRVEFLQDILHIDGSSIWQETLTIMLEQCAKKELMELTACMERSANVVKQLNNLSSPSTVFGNIPDPSLLERHACRRFH
ncbi:hypothetical protein PR202_gb15820 [Eleusine coracana subsp. coracana]|uniref:Uncharacterized protein n=1 Tax=Eleusine coracana subsp. coracana TaxID=191504 RepID=A0AAV5EYN1_ELECO|nr:hypothetical protein PR202_gb15820 [Eleusine coracana subsp. coracana]